MTQYVYGKNVVKQLLQDGKPIHEVLIQEGIRDTALEGEIKKRRIPVKVLGAGRAAGKHSAGKTAAAGDAGRLGRSS